MTRDRRRELIQSLENRRNSKVIVYVTSDRQGCSAQIAGDVISIIHDHILQLPEPERAKLDLVVYSRGGNSDVPWTLVSMFREYCHAGSFGVLIPYRAHSAATVISLGADEIIMTKKAELGPIDATIMSGPYNPTESSLPNRLPVSVEDVNGFFALLERIGCERPSEKMTGFGQLTDKVHPLALGAVNRQLEETKLVGLRLLSTRATPFSEDQNHEIIRKLSSEVYSHSHTISRTEASKYLGLKHVKKAEDFDVEEELWQLYLCYRDLFSLEDPFKPEEHLISNGIDQYSWQDLPIACIESVGRFDLCQKSLQVRRLRNIPPQLQVNVQNLGFPAINFGTIPEGLNGAGLQRLVETTVKATVQGSLNEAVEASVRSLLASMPSKGFEHTSFNNGWVTVEE